MKKRKYRVLIRTKPQFITVEAENKEEAKDKALYTFVSKVKQYLLTTECDATVTDWI